MTTPDEETLRAQKLLKQLQEGDHEQEREVAETLKQIINESNEPRRMPKAVFEEIFLPFIVGRVESTNEQNYIEHWAGLVGQSTVVEVCDVDGKVIFTVPPLVDTSIINLDSDTRIDAVLTEYGMDASVNPARAKGTLAAGMAAELGKTIRSDSKENWDSMLTYYGLKKPEAAENKSTQPTVSKDFEDE